MVISCVCRIVLGWCFGFDTVEIGDYMRAIIICANCQQEKEIDLDRFGAETKQWLKEHKTRIGGCDSFKALKHSSHFFIKSFKSASSSETVWFSATVRTITPKFFGFIDCINSFKRLFSSKFLIFEETEILSAKGINTKYLPAKLISVVIRGPFALIGSLATCTNKF